MNVLGAFPSRHTILSVLLCVKLWPAHARFHIIHATPAFPPFLPSRNIRRRRRRRPRLRDRPKCVDSSHEVTTTSKGLQSFAAAAIWQCNDTSRREHLPD